MNSWSAAMRAGRLDHPLRRSLRCARWRAAGRHC
jgi:hypothetical protein